MNNVRVHINNFMAIYSFHDYSNRTSFHRKLSETFNNKYIKKTWQYLNAEKTDGI